MDLRRGLLGSYMVVCAFALVWPGYAWFGNGVTPYVLGLPWSFAWNVGWVLATFGVLVGYHFSGGEAG
jgi:hypothetical protein